MEILLILSTGLVNVLCFLIGVKTAQQVNKGEPVEVPVVKSPLTVYREKQERQEAEKEQNKIDAILRNIENYDGTGSHQEDIPR